MGWPRTRQITDATRAGELGRTPGPPPPGRVADWKPTGGLEKMIPFSWPSGWGFGVGRFGKEKR
ncbi:hypothetical protein CGRA01v4_05427 [Colletotrichum graminicola]|nr:hypothetical protein CGRA01v4_05427 [Colletotrichum graminicola]